VIKLPYTLTILMKVFIDEQILYTGSLSSDQWGCTRALAVSEVWLVSSLSLSEKLKSALNKHVSGRTFVQLQYNTVI